ncbi:CHAP domain-containing protein [Thermomonospora umbrina]|uniref:CHAP domain-containing protein n=1 Tax=Thermomonospora umbrina TaxID=111806 RepID=UPI000E27472E|nr:CHAP domain-containing protein [Thermomonospora umbrina]
MGKISAVACTGLVAVAMLGAAPAWSATTAHIESVAAKASSVAAGDDYPYRNGSWHEADPWNFYKRECTSFVAWRMRQLGVRFHNHYKGVRWSNANNWDNAARRVGVRVDRRATVGAVAQWNRGRFGHVAYVSHVGRGTVTIEEYNRNGGHHYGRRTIRTSQVENFIHIAR